jgi:phosphoglycolate phosphatase
MSKTKTATAVEPKDPASVRIHAPIPDPDKIICIGDETRDIEAARAVGLDCGAVGWGYAKPSILAQHGPTVSFNSMSEIISYVGASKTAVGGD